MIDKQTFNAWMSEFFNNKQNQLEYSQQNQPKRFEKLVLDLSAAPLNPYRVPVPFKSLWVKRYFQTSSPSTVAAGSIELITDQNNLANLNNRILLNEYDVAKTEVLVGESYLTWEAQADTSVEIYFFVDIEFISGTVKTAVTGNVVVSGTVATKPAVPLATVRINGASATYTVPAGRVALVRAYCGNSANMTFDGDVVLKSSFANNNALGLDGNLFRNPRGADDDQEARVNSGQSYKYGVLPSQDVTGLGFNGGNAVANEPLIPVFAASSTTAFTAVTQTFTVLEGTEIDINDVSGEAFAWIEEYAA